LAIFLSAILKNLGTDTTMLNLSHF